jgi:AcrR family transcriptional regulator
MTTPLQDRRAALGRDAVLDALVVHLEAGTADSISMEDLAREAGVSRRTLYRYFPTRADLLAAALLTYLCSLNAWVSLQDESGLSPERAEDAVLWAIELIQRELQPEPRKDTSR